MVQSTCCGDGQECIVTDVSGLADPCMASCNVFYRLPDGSIWLLNKDGDGYQEVFVANDDLPKIDWNADPDSDAGISNRPFKAIGWGLTKDNDGNITLDKLVLPTPDWNVTDPTNKDYIANKPFQTIGDHLYVEDSELNVCLENRTNELPNSTWNLGQGTWIGWGSPIQLEIQNPELDKPNSHILHALPSTKTTQQLSNLPHPIWVNAGEVVTLSFDYKENNLSTPTHAIFALRIFPQRDTANSSANSLWNKYINYADIDVIEAVEDFTRFTYEFTATTSGWLDIIPYDIDGTGTHESWWREIMVIKGKACEMPDRWYPYFTDIPIPEQVQSDWNVTDTNSKAFIKNKPTIPPEQVQSDWNVTDTNSKAFIKNKPTIPEGAKLYPTTGDNTDGAMTQKAVTDELNKKANTADLSKYVTLDTAQIITGDKTFTKGIYFNRGIATKRADYTGLVTYSTFSETSGRVDYMGITNSIDVAGTAGTTTVLIKGNRNIAGQTSNNMVAGIGTGATLVLGGGEGHQAYMDAMEAGKVPAGSANGGTENIILASDNETYIGSNYQSGGVTGYWWKFGKDGKLYSPDGSEYVTKDTASQARIIPEVTVSTANGETLRFNGVVVKLTDACYELTLNAFVTLKNSTAGVKEFDVSKEIPELLALTKSQPLNVAYLMSGTTYNHTRVDIKTGGKFTINLDLTPNVSQNINMYNIKLTIV